MKKKAEKVEKNYAFMDGQNLFLGTTSSEDPWVVDLYRLRVYLRRKYNVERAYYFLGCVDESNQKLYERIQDAGFILIFREHGSGVLSSKKGNVDTDIVFTMMRDFHEREEIDKFYLISGDGDYYRTVKYLHEQGKLGAVFFPSKRNASSVYRQLSNAQFIFLDKPGIRMKIELKK